jgi:C4-dicarboxylate transporter DctM subunit
MMSPETIGVIGIIILFMLIALRIPIGIAMALVGYLGASSILGLEAGTAILGISPFDTAKSYTLSVVPLFVLMGLFASYSGITKETYHTVHRWVGHLPGGLAMATIGACAGFAAVCGSSIATAATIGKVTLPEMKEYGYDDKLATGCIAAGGTLGILIPPSMSFIIYATITEQSVGKLFIAGILPGIFLSALFMLTIYIMTKRNIKLGPPAPKSTWMERLRATARSWGVLLLFFLVMGGIWFGIFTPTEAAGVGTFIAFILVIINKQLSRETIIESLKDTTKTTGMIFVLVIGALIFNYFMAVSKLPMAMSNFVSGLGIPRHGVLTVIIFIYLFLGCLMDTLSMLLLTLPIIFPTVFALGFDPIWFGVIMTLLTETALITPPIGMNVFVIGGIAKDVPLETIFRGIAPFLIALGVCLVILILFPEISLFLPSFMR